MSNRELRAAIIEARDAGLITPESASKQLNTLRGFAVGIYSSLPQEWAAWQACEGSGIVIGIATANRETRR